MDQGMAVAEPGDAAEAPLLFTYSTPAQPWFRRSVIRLVERLSGRAALERLYRDWAAAHDPDETLFAAGLRLLRVRSRIAPQDLALVPDAGGVLLLANHPFGIIDGMILGDLGVQLRGEVKIMSHSLLCQPPESRSVMLPVDFSGTPEARRVSAGTRRAAQAWLEAGKVLVVFPAGSVSTTETPFSRHAVDTDWHGFVVRLAALPGVSAVPVFIAGQNSRLFQIVSHLSYPLRVALIFAETRAWAGRVVTLRIGAPVVVDASDKAGAAEVLRRACYAMAGPGGPKAAQRFVWPKHIRW